MSSISYLNDNFHIFKYKIPHLVVEGKRKNKTNVDEKSNEMKVNLLCKGLATSNKTFP